MNYVLILSSCAAIAVVAVSSGSLRIPWWRAFPGVLRRPKACLEPEGASEGHEGSNGHVELSAPAVTQQPGWTLIRCDDEVSFRDWLNREDRGHPLKGDEEPALGTHLLVELYGCPHEALDDVPNVGHAMREAADRSGATTVATSFHEFEPFGVSGAVIIQESHYTIHTWPEHGYAAVDLFYCGGTVDVRRAVEVLRESFRPRRMKFLVIRRGLEGEVGS